MKRFIFKTFWFFCILFASFMITTSFFSWVIKNSHIYIDGYGLKEKLLSETEPPRIIFQGGSNVSFGINSNAVEDSLQIRTLNIALEVGLGMRLMLSEALDYCHEGDILMLSPEYHHFYGGAYGKSETLAVLTLLYPTITKYFNVKQLIRAAKGIPKAGEVMRGLLVYIVEDAVSNSSNHYSYSSLSFNAHGDEVMHWTYPQENSEIKAEIMSDTFDEDYFVEFCETIDNLETRGIKVIIIPPSLYNRYYEEEKNKMNYVAERLRNVGHPFEFEQELCNYEREDMFDSPYHLAKSGIDKRMKLIIDVLKSHK